MVEFLHLQPRPLASGAAAAAVVFAADAESLIVGAAGYDAARSTDFLPVVGERRAAFLVERGGAPAAHELRMAFGEVGGKMGAAGKAVQEYGQPASAEFLEL